MRNIKKALVAFVAIAVLALPAYAWTGYTNTAAGNESGGNKYDCPPGEDVAVAVKGPSDTGAKVRYRSTAVQITPSIITYNGDVQRSSSTWFVAMLNQNTVWQASGSVTGSGRLQAALNDIYGTDGPVSATDWGCISNSNGLGWYYTTASNPLTP